ncbi:MAG: GIY-YIG nuclease family protein, partial [Streptococcaceae bacterium]|nr:GIY-YIG nuclease family protein [Streptococcaceae bacterium]
MNSKLNELKEKSKHLPETPGVYLMKNNQGEVIYVGKAKNLKRRVSSYFMNSKNRQPKIERMITRIDTFEVKLVPTELEALLLERRLIHQLRPMNNRQMNKFERYKYLSLINKPNLKIEVDGKMNGVYSLGPFR